jgi:membrane-bound serine protease (ClpP class)
MTLVEQFRSLLANPDLAYVLLVVGIIGLIFEFSAPGISIPGVAGGISVALALVGFGSLPTNIVGLLLIGLAIVLFIVDIKTPTHGILAAGGIAVFLLGSFLIFPPWQPAVEPIASPVHISPVTIIVVTLLLSLFFVFVIYKGIAAQKRVIQIGGEIIEGTAGETVTELCPEGQVRAVGEVWSARSAFGNIAAGEPVVVVGRKGLTLVVKKKGEV